MVVLLVMPVTSPIPIVVPRLPIKSVKLPMAKTPVVVDGLEAERFNTLFTVRLAAAVAPPVALMVRFWYTGVADTVCATPDAYSTVPVVEKLFTVNAGQ